MSCQGCLRSVTSIISAATGLEKDAIDVDLEKAQACFEAPTDAPLDTLAQKLEAAGFVVTR
jgi:copper chaperone CopZ